MTTPKLKTNTNFQVLRRNYVLETLSRTTQHNLTLNRGLISSLKELAISEATQKNHGKKRFLLSFWRNPQSRLGNRNPNQFASICTRNDAIIVQSDADPTKIVQCYKESSWKYNPDKLNDPPQNTWKHRYHLQGSCKWFEVRIKSIDL